MVNIIFKILLDVTQPMEEELKRVMRLYPLGVCIVTTNWKGVPVGMTVNTFNSLSLNPPLVTFFADKTRGNDIPFKESKEFAVNFVDKEEVLDTFATKPVSERFKLVKYFENEDKLPILSSVYAYIIANKYETIDVGDHSIIIGEVKSVKILRDKFDPIVYLNRKYHKVI